MYLNKITTLPIIIPLLFGGHCSTQTSGIRGNIQMSEGWKPMVYLVQPRSFAEIASSFSGTVLDSASIAADGSFFFGKSPQNADARLLQLCIQQTGNRFANQLLDDPLANANYMPVVCSQNEELEISANAAAFQASFSLKHPSPENRALLHLRDLRQAAFQQEIQWLGKDAHADESTLLELEAARLRFQKPLMDFADSCAQWWPALVAVRWVSPVSDYERVAEFMHRQCEHWRGKTPENPWVLQLCEAGSRARLPVLIGDSAPDFPLPMTTGDTLMLHALLGKKITILDIWASWCAPCRQENRAVLAPLWAEYKDRGLQILGYSIDSSPAAWKAAIEKDKAHWPHASHLSGDETPFLEALRIQTIPANFILDAQGVVIAKNLHGEALKAFLKELIPE